MWESTRKTLVSRSSACMNTKASVLCCGQFLNWGFTPFVNIPVSFLLPPCGQMLATWIQEGHREPAVTLKEWWRNNEDLLILIQWFGISFCGWVNGDVYRKPPCNSMWPLLLSGVSHRQIYPKIWTPGSKFSNWCWSNWCKHTVNVFTIWCLPINNSAWWH